MSPYLYSTLHVCIHRWRWILFLENRVWRTFDRTKKVLRSKFTYCSLPQRVLFFRGNSSEIDGFIGSFLVDPCWMYQEQPLTNDKPLQVAGLEDPFAWRSESRHWVYCRLPGSWPAESDSRKLGRTCTA